MTNKKYKLSLFIFRRDLRLEDNSGLIAALKKSERVILCFIFDERQVINHDYFSQKAFRFMLESLDELQRAITKKKGALYFFKGKSENITEKMLTHFPIDAVFINRDYTPFSKTRDEAILSVAKKYNRDFFICSDLLLHEPEEVLKKDGSPYIVYTPFMKKSREFFVKNPVVFSLSNFYTEEISYSDNNFLDAYLKKYNDQLIMPGGRKAGLKLLQQIFALQNYAIDRDILSLNATSHLSPHHKFGTISIRETYYQIMESMKNSILVNELYWRDFFTHIAFHFPHVFQGAFHTKYNRIKWSNNLNHFQRWCDGETGFPIVDAGMRELNETGLMHNRVRMITASFLVKDLHINWQWGEKYFAQKLIDYDPAVNNGNWQWAASTGCDAQPYFRIFNPLLQQKRFDPDFLYVKKWVPEYVDLLKYPDPIVDHAAESQISKLLFKKAINLD